MKLLNILTLGATSAALVLAAGCADDFDTNGFKVDQPQETAQYEYLQAYGPLKSYVNRSGVGPIFRLGGALDASEMNKRGLVYALAVANYDEVTFGNHMKHNFVMNADGAMDFGTIRSAIETARNGGLKIFGHTLCWHEQQQGKYLLSLLKDKEIEVDPDQKKEVLDYEINWGSQDDYSMWGQWGKGATTAINTADDCLEVVNPEAAANFWDLQFFIADGFNIAKGTEYELTVTARTLGGEANVRGAIGTWSETKNLAFTVNEEWNDYKVKFTSEFEGGSHVLVQFGDFVGTVQFKSVKLTHSEAAAITIPVNVLEDDFSSGEVPAGWGNGSTREIQDGVLVMTNPSKVNSWEAQTAYDVSTPFEVDTRYFLTMKIKGSKAGSISAGFQNPDGYKGCGDFPAINVTTDWTEVKVATTCNGDGASRFLFSYGAYDGT
ncbi:MAG: endo-1,4-beta-xylanase, partial [Muribaculaceae bacterium]|nr:endo-1,4-beta-xylanase [Muribaculaceae bacterium]